MNRLETSTTQIKESFTLLEPSIDDVNLQITTIFYQKDKDTFSKFCLVPGEDENGNIHLVDIHGANEETQFVEEQIPMIPPRQDQVRLEQFASQCIQRTRRAASKILN